MTPQDPGVYISPAQMYQEVRGLARSVDRIETKLDAIHGDTRAITEDIADHESRLRVLERARWPLPTIAVLTGLAGAGTSVVALLGR